MHLKLRRRPAEGLRFASRWPGSQTITISKGKTLQRRFVIKSPMVIHRSTSFLTDFLVLMWVELSWVDNWPIWTQCTGIGYKCQPELLSHTTEVICISYFWLFAKNVNLSYRSAILTRNNRVLCVSYFNPFSFSSKMTSQNQKWVLKKQNHPPKTVGKVQNLPIQKNLIVDLWKYVT